MLGEFRRHIYKYILDLLHSKTKHSIGTACIDIYTAMEVSTDSEGLSGLYEEFDMHKKAAYNSRMVWKIYQSPEQTKTATALMY